jgi:E3 ubiquitin-protein ligase synoviolin
MERSPIVTLLFHARIIGLMSLLILLDLNFVYIAYNHTLAKGASVQLVFGFEYAILFVNILSILIKYLLHTIDLQNENPWENKGIYMLYGDLLLGFARLILYMTFMALMIKIHTFPLFAIRPMYISLRSFRKALNDVIMSRRAIRNLNIMYPDVTPEQLRNYTDTICIICREEMSSAPVDGDNNNNNNERQPMQQIKKLPCDHIFHKSCLRSWFQRQQTCPTCRTSILRLNPTVAPAAAPAAAGVPGQGGAAQHQQQGQQQEQPNAQRQNQSPFIRRNQQERTAQVPLTPQTSTNFDHFIPNFNGNQFPLPPFAFMPPPLPPLNLDSHLTIEQLQAMEGDERHNLEARIHCLRNLNILLNTSMIQIQQYMNMCTATRY